MVSWKKEEKSTLTTIESPARPRYLRLLLDEDKNLPKALAATSIKEGLGVIDVIVRTHSYTMASIEIKQQRTKIKKERKGNVMEFKRRKKRRKKERNHKLHQHLRQPFLQSQKGHDTFLHLP